MYIAQPGEKGRIRDNSISAIKNLIETKDKTITHFVYLGRQNGNRWALVFAWQDGFEYDDRYDNDNPCAMKGNEDEISDWNIVGKIAYQPINSLMQEYDIDWLMPYDGKTSEVLDTETSIDGLNIERDIDWFLKEWADNHEEYFKITQ